MHIGKLRRDYSKYTNISQKVGDDMKRERDGWMSLFTGVAFCSVGVEDNRAGNMSYWTCLNVEKVILRDI